MRTLSSKRRSVEAMPEENIDFSDIPEADDRFWRRAKLETPKPAKRAYVARTPSRSTPVRAAAKKSNRKSAS